MNSHNFGEKAVGDQLGIQNISPYTGSRRNTVKGTGFITVYFVKTPALLSNSEPLQAQEDKQTEVIHLVIHTGKNQPNMLRIINKDFDINILKLELNQVFKNIRSVNT